MTLFYVSTPNSAIRWLAENASPAKYSRLYAFGEYPYKYMEQFAGQSQGSYRCTAEDMEEISGMYECESYDTDSKRALLLIDYPGYAESFDDRFDYLLVRTSSREEGRSLP